MKKLLTIIYIIYSFIIFINELPQKPNNNHIDINEFGYGGHVDGTISISGPNGVIVNDPDPLKVQNILKKSKYFIKKLL